MFILTLLYNRQIIGVKILFSIYFKNTLYTKQKRGILLLSLFWSVGEVVNTLGSHPSIQGFEPPTDYQLKMLQIVQSILYRYNQCF